MKRLTLLLFVGVFVLACTEETAPPLSAGFDVLVVTDSNGVGAQAWPAQLAALFSRDPSASIRVHVEARSGRTWAIDRGGEATWAVGGMLSWLEDARRATDGRVEAVVLVLGTNDLQARFAGGRPLADRSRTAVQETLRIITRVAPETLVVVVAPPPFCDAPPGRGIDARWEGAPARRADLVAGLEAGARSSGARWQSLDVGAEHEVCALVGRDGVHLSTAGHAWLAEVLAPSIAALRD